MPSYHYETSKIALDENRRHLALQKLFDHQRSTDEYIQQELPVFQFYINAAIRNVQNLCGTKVLSTSDFEPDKIVKCLRQDSEDVRRAIEKLADFLWLFKVDVPLADYRRDYRELTLALVRQLYMARSFLCHPNGQGNHVIMANQSFYIFFAGELAATARDRVASMGGLKTDKLYKMRLMTPQRICRESAAPDAPRVDEKCTYYLTRRGLVMLICLALYRDEASEFCQALKDMKLLTRDLESQWEELSDTDRESEEAKVRKKAGANKALHEFFMFYSMRRSYNAVNSENHDWSCFTDIIAYLNKVPELSWRYLELAEERADMARRFEQSTETLENKISKYTLHRRMKDRTLSFIAAYCEDFGLMKDIHFKRLDVSDHLGRQRYCFGVENATDCRQNRHYAIVDDAIRFEYRPAEHFGDIHISSLRGAISSSELRRLVIADTRFGGFANTELNRYLSAYQRILERMMMERDCSYIDRASYLDDMMAISGATRETLQQDDGLKAALAPYFPANLIRFFIPTDNIPSDEVLAQTLTHTLKLAVRRDDETLKALKLLRDHQRQPREERQPLPRECRFSDGDLVQRVFDLLNLHLEPERKYRQLPRGERHRQQQVDIEYQLMHALIGRFAQDDKALWDRLKGVRPIMGTKSNRFGKPIPTRIGEEPLPPELVRAELRPVAKDLKERYERVLGEERRFLAQHPRFDARKRPIQARPSLMMLATAAVQAHRDYCLERLGKLKQKAIGGREELERECRRFGLRVGQQLDYPALIRTILHLDLERWENAYNYKQGEKWQDRSLMQDGHIVTQIPILNGFAEQALKQHYLQKNGALPFLDNNTGHIRFGKILHQKLSAPVRLRGYYATDPLMRLRCDGDTGGTAWSQSLPPFPDDPEQCQPGLKYRLDEPVPGKGKLLDIIYGIKDQEYQDRLLLHIALRYHGRYTTQTDAVTIDKEGRMTFVAGASVYEYFDYPQRFQLVEGLTMVFRPNDRLRYVFSKIIANKKALAAILRTKGYAGQVDFYDVVREFRLIEANDRRIRMELMSGLLQLEDKVTDPMLPQEMPHDERHAKLYEVYLPHVAGKNAQQRRAKFTLQDFETLVDFRNEVFHNGFALDESKAKRCQDILRTLGVQVVR